MSYTTRMDVPVAFSPDPNSLAYTSSKTIKLQKIETAMLQSLTCHSECVAALAFSPNDQVLVSAPGDGTVKLWDAVIKSIIKTTKDDLDTVQFMVFSPDGKALASTSGEDSLTKIKLWDVTLGSGREISKTYPSSRVLQCGSSLDATLLAVASNKKNRGAMGYRRRQNMAQPYRSSTRSRGSGLLARWRHDSIVIMRPDSLVVGREHR